MLEKAIIALTLGFSFERIFSCPFVALSLSMSDKWAGLKFILGRILGIVILGLVIAGLGIPFNIPVKFIDILFGFFLVIMGAEVFLNTGQKHKSGKFARASFGLGLFRGSLNPGRKIFLLVPMLLGSGLVEAFIVSFSYALGSSALLAAGFLSAEALNKFTSHRKAVRTAGGLILIVLGTFYIWQNIGNSFKIF